MTEQNLDTQAERPSEAVGLEGLSEKEIVMGVRFFAAARAGSPEAARNLITQEIKPSDKKLRLEGAYNPVLEGISIAERKDYWEKDGSPYEEALDKWRNRFTTVINRVTDETRIAAFKSILPDDPALKDKALSQINQDDATRLFREYSENKSDIDLFMRRAIANLTAQGVLQPEALQAHIAHLRWIGTGFFGKETASMIGTQILLEVERRKNLAVISEFIDENMDRVNSFGPEEAETLRAVRQQAIARATTPAARPQPATQPEDDDLLPPPIENPGTVDPQRDEHDDESEGNLPDAQSATNPNPASTTPDPHEPSTPVVETNTATPPENPQGLKENIIAYRHGEATNLTEWVNDHLKTQTAPNVTFVVPPRELMEYMISAFAEGKVEVGRMETSRDDKITISRVAISQAGGSVTINNITVSNKPNVPGSISATVGKIEKSLLAKAFAGNVEQQMSTINDVFLTELKKRINADNDSWIPKSLSISKGMITVGFEKSD